MKQKNRAKKNGRYLLLLWMLAPLGGALAQNDTAHKARVVSDTSASRQNLAKQRDLIDLFVLWILRKNPDYRLNNNTKKQTGHLHISGAPSPSYSLATSLGFNVTGNIAFYAGDRNSTNISAILISPLYTIKKQLALPVQFSLWTKGNQFNIIGDWRFLTYPEATYGLGGLTTDADTTSLDYHYVRLYTFVLKTIARNCYAGIGYQYDNHWDIRQLYVPAGKITDFDSYGYSSSSISSGVSANLLYDSRKNSINPEAGSTYANIVFRQNLQALGSDGNWESLLLDFRKFFRLNDHTHNILAIWSYSYLTLNGKPPYMDLPSTGWDTYGNTGRGYIQSRFRSENMTDLEAEYRFGILSNGLLGGVVFGNLQSYSEYPSNRFEAIEPGYGAGLRIKFNKFSKTNVCLDYGFGLHGSNGLFVNLGEVF